MTSRRTALLEAIASAWCVPPNENKRMDADLANTIADQVIGLRWLSGNAEQLEARFLWLADKVIAPDYGDNDSSPHRKGYLLEHCKGPDVIYGDSLEAAIDEMIELEKKHG